MLTPSPVDPNAPRPHVSGSLRPAPWLTKSQSLARSTTRQRARGLVCCAQAPAGTPGQQSYRRLNHDRFLPRFRPLHPPRADRTAVGLKSPVLTQAVWKLFFGDRDEISIHEAGLSRNNDSPTLPSGFKYCAEGLGAGVFTQPGPDSDIGDDERKGWGNNAWCLPGHHDRRAAVLATQDFLHSQLDPGRVPVGGLHHVYRFAA